MRALITGLLLVITSGALTGCDQATDETRKASAPAPTSGASSEGRGRVSQRGQQATVAVSAAQDRGDASVVSLANITTAYAAAEALDRKIIRNAELTLDTESPSEGLRKITAAAESHGGFVVTSEFKQNPALPGAKASETVTVVARVPASQFASALEQIRSAGERVISEKVSGQDVSEEYLDLEARLRSKKALEAQFLEIMKQARKVQDALDVQSHLADVRTEIERLEGRRRFFENQAALSTITTTLQMPQPLVAATTSGLSASIKHAFGDSVDTAAAIILFIIRAVIVLFPIAVILGFPGWLIWRAMRRKVLVRKAAPSPVPNE